VSGTSDGIKFSSDGLPLLLRDSHLASDIFSLNQPQFTTIPHIKYMFYVRFVRNAAQGSSTTGTNLDWSNGLSFVVKTVDRPKVEFETQVVNEYNKKRILQTKVNYHPISIKFHDTVDNLVMNMFEEYFKYYYADPRNVDPNAWRSDQTAASFAADVGGWGFLPPTTTTAAQTYFFNHVEIYRVYGGNYTQIDLVNPKILSFEPDEMDYSHGGVSAEVSMALGYEGIVYVANNQALSSNPDLVNMMQLNLSSFYEPENSNLAQPTNQTPLSTISSLASNYNPLSGLLNQYYSPTQGAQNSQPFQSGGSFAGQYQDYGSSNPNLLTANNSTPGFISASQVPVISQQLPVLSNSALGAQQFSTQSNTGISMSSDNQSGSDLRGLGGLY
jgi:hypothetical protein